MKSLNKYKYKNPSDKEVYSPDNPPPYPVTSVNGKTGAVTVSVPGTPIYEHLVSIHTDLSAFSGSSYKLGLQLYYKFIAGDKPEEVARNPLNRFLLTGTSIDEYMPVSGECIEISGTSSTQMIVILVKLGPAGESLTLIGFGRETSNSSSSIITKTISDPTAIQAMTGAWISSVQVGVN